MSSKAEVDGEKKYIWLLISLLYPKPRPFIIVIYCYSISTLFVVTGMLPKEITKAIKMLEFLKRMDGCYPNTEIAYRILLTIPVTVVSIEVFQSWSS